MTLELPHNPDAEQSTVGCVLIDPDCLTDLHFLKPSDFHDTRLKWIWEAIKRLHTKRASIDTVTVGDELTAMGAQVDPSFLTTLIYRVPTSLNAESYARIVEEDALRRRVIAASGKAATAAYNAETIEQIQEAANGVTEAVYRESDSDNVFKAGLSAVYDRAGENAQRTANGEPLNVGLTTGFIDLDRILLGIENEESVIVGARPGEGKTSFLLNIASHASMTLGKRVAIFSQEMSAEEVTRRLLSAHTGIDSQRIKIGALKEHEWPVFTNAFETLEATEIYLSDASSLTPAKLRAKCLKLKQTQGVDLILVDYLQLMSAGIKTENRTREVGYISRNIKMLTREIKTPIISACQLSREIEKRSEKRPTLSDLRDAGDIEQDANTVMFLYRPDPVNSTSVDVIIAKRRDGAVGTASLVYKPNITKFVNATSKTFSVE